MTAWLVDDDGFDAPVLLDSTFKKYAPVLGLNTRQSSISGLDGIVHFRLTEPSEVRSHTCMRTHLSHARSLSKLVWIGSGLVLGAESGFACVVEVQ